VNPAARHAERLLEAAQRLERAMGQGDAEGLAAATAEREAAFQALVASVGETPPQQLHATLREVREIDRRVLDRVPSLRDALRQERELLGLARDAARAVRPKDAPRFLDVRA
jgi:hypothetical protein